jgi:hypothetical protein
MSGFSVEEGQIMKPGRRCDLEGIERKKQATFRPQGLNPWASSTFSSKPDKMGFAPHSQYVILCY